MNIDRNIRTDHRRLNRSMDGVRSEFRDLAVQNRQKAMQFLNDGKIGFPTLFLLMPDIEALNLYEELIPRNITAIQICAKKSNPDLSVRLEQLLHNDDETVRGALKWMLETGLHWDGPRKQYDSFDAALDTAAALLIGTYKDNTVLPAVAELIFRRNRKGLLIHDLVWSFFQSYDPDALKLLAGYLLSSDPSDVELACKLLHLTIPAGEGRQKYYSRYMFWLNENKPYLRFTGEHLQQTSEPNPLHVDLEARYLGKGISPKNGRPLEPLTRDETACLARFRTAPEEDQEILSAYSARMHDHDIRSWEKWMGKTLSEQIGKAKAQRRVAR